MFLFDPFFWEVVISGLLAGVMYALVALGFVLIFKASGIFNFAQGVLALFAALTLVPQFDHRVEDGGFQRQWLRGWPFQASIV